MATPATVLVDAKLFATTTAAQVVRLCVSSPKAVCAVDKAQCATRRWLREAFANLVAHLFAEGRSQGRAFFFVDVPAIEDVEVFEDGVTIAGHRENRQQLVRRSARTCHLPSANRVGAVLRFEPAKLCHVSG